MASIIIHSHKLNHVLCHPNAECVVVIQYIITIYTMCLTTNSVAYNTDMRHVLDRILPVGRLVWYLCVEVNFKSGKTIS